MSISKRINARMSAIGMRSVDLAENTSTPLEVVNQWLTGSLEPCSKTMTLIAKTLRCDPEWIKEGK